MTLATLNSNRAVDTLPERLEYSRALAVSNLLPAQYRGKPENVLYAIEFGRSLGIEPIAAINGVHIIEGRPSASAGLISALVRRAGHRLRVWVERDSQGQLVAAVATIIRKDDPDFEFRATWTMARAHAANLTGKSVWKNYPEAMLKARAISEVAREACEEELSGVSYTPEELGAEVNADGSVVVTTAPARPNMPGQTIRQAVAPTAEPPAAAEAEPAAERMISQPQQKKMAALMREAGLADRDSALTFVNEVLARPADNQVTSRNQLTLDEAWQVIDALEREVSQQSDEPVDADVVDEPAEQAS
jgi:hypothetical protein